MSRRVAADCHGSSAGGHGGHTGHLYTTRAKYAPAGAGAAAAQDLRSGPGPMGGEWPDPFQNDSDRASASETAAAVDSDVIDAASSSHSS